MSSKIASKVVLTKRTIIITVFVVVSSINVIPMLNKGFKKAKKAYSKRILKKYSILYPTKL